MVEDVTVNSVKVQLSFLILLQVQLEFLKFLKDLQHVEMMVGQVSRSR